MKVLIVGGGGREHALAWAIAKSPKLTKLYAAPGNAGIADVAACLDIQAEDKRGICAAIRDLEVDFVVIGPEGPLVDGLADKIEAMGVAVFGPSAAAAEIEGSKGMMKDLLAKYDIPTADYQRFDEPDAAKEYIRVKNHPVVVKADGLAAGKGVILSHTLNEAYAAVDQIMIEEAFGSAGNEIIIEEFMIGEEAASLHCATACAPCRWPARKTTNKCTTATTAQIQAAWGPTAPPQCSTLPWKGA